VGECHGLQGRFPAGTDDWAEAGKNRGYNTMSTRKKGWHIADKSVREYRIDLNGKLFARIRQ
jgi:hypothetical protein